MQDRPYVVLDVGSGYSKLGFAGNLQPTYVLPTVLSTKHHEHMSRAGGAATRDPLKGMEDLDYFIGEDALNNSHPSYNLTYPMRQSMVEDWDALERFYQQCLFQYLRVEPEDHSILLTEPVGATTESRQQLAEIMFETFGVSGMYLGVQAVMSLYAAMSVAKGEASLRQGEAPGQPPAPMPWTACASATRQQGLDPSCLTGVVVDVGEGSTSVIPVVEGWVSRSGLRSMQLGGRDLTHHIQQAIRGRQAGVPPHMSWDVARKIKESHCYVCSNPDSEAGRLAAKQAQGKISAAHVCRDPRAGGKEVCVPLGPELFTAPELLLTGPPAGTAGGAQQPSRQALTGWQPLPEMIDQVVQSCPIDARRPLYRSVALTGGTTCIRNFGRRVQVELSSVVNKRLVAEARAIDVQVLCGSGWGPHAAWLGGSLIAGGGVPKSMLTAATTSRAHWQEHGTLLGPGLLD